ncbi:MAG: hypothetical protein HYX65_08280 [Gemmatimonadetes bacterium]|nr:hypothetical protein [Gemmatimonadota bacterium]
MRAPLALALALLAGCSAPGATGTGAASASRLTVVQGSGQSGQVGRLLPTQVVLRATDDDGNGVKDVPVNLAIGDGVGSVDPPSARTDENGEVKAKWTLGPSAVSQTLIASAPGVHPETLSASGIVPSTIVIAQGNLQSGKVTTELTNSIVIRVTSSTNVPMVGVTVALQVVGGGGAITPQSAVTSALGEVSVKWKMGTVAGPNTANVIVSTIPPALLTATATP